MSKLNFEQTSVKPSDVGGPPGWVLMLVADVLVASLAGLALLHAGF